MTKETINKAAFVKKIQNKLEERDDYLTLEEVNAFLDVVLDSIIDTVKKDQGISIVGFGKFEIRERAARKGRNPQTGEEIKIPARRVVSFSAGKILKDAVPKRKKKKSK